MNLFFLFSNKGIVNDRFIATIYLIIMCVQIGAIEGYGISPIKVILMSLSPLLFFFKVPYVTRALLWSIAYWMSCNFCAAFNGGMRFSTVGYLGLFLSTFIIFYHLIYSGTFTINYFFKLLRWLIMAYGIILILQQAAILIGLRSLWLINLDNQPFLSLTKLPALSLEPSHSARFLTVMMLGYLRCLEIANNGVRTTIPHLFSRAHRKVTILFLWVMLTMGSGTAFIGLGILSLYFIQRKTFFYIIPLLCSLFYIGQVLELEQMNRAVKIAQTVISGGNAKKIHQADGSGAYRVIPLINTLTKTDITKKDSWFGHGTLTKEFAANNWKRTTDKLAIVEQYGLLTLIISLILVYTCIIRRFFCIETLMFILLFGASLGNTAYIWGAMMIFTVIRYLQIQKENGLLNLNNEITT